LKLKITSGSLKGRYLDAPKGEQTRPTSEKVRQSFFNAHRSLVEEAIFLDLFAGSGAMGIEALSCGASDVILVENHRLAIQAIEKNLQLLQIVDQVTLVRKDALQALEELERKKTTFSIIFVDPPYAHIAIKEKVLLFCDQSSLLKEGGFLFLEENIHHQTSIKTLPLKNLVLRKTKEIGETLIHEFIYT